MNRRCTSEVCLVEATAKTVNLDMPVATLLTSPRAEWKRIAQGRGRTARSIEVNWNNFTTDKYIFSHCFAENTQILMSDGSHKNIQDIQVGEEVVTHTGSVKKVTETMCREHSDGLVEIKVSGLPEKIYATKEHPFYKQFRYKKCGCGCGQSVNWKNGCRFVLGHQYKVYGHPRGERYQENKSEFIERENSFVWEESEGLEAGDRLALGAFANGTIETEKDFARLLGYYLAEGWVQKEPNKNCKDYGEYKTCQFAFSGDEELTYVSEVVDLLNRLSIGKAKAYDKRTQGNEDSNCIVIRVADKKLASKLLKYGGSLSGFKKIHTEVFQWTPERQRDLLSCWYRGDAGVAISKNLAWGMKYIANNCNIPTNLHARPAKVGSDGVYRQASWSLQLRPSFMKLNQEEFGCETGKPLAKTKRVNCHGIVAERLTSRISKIRELPCDKVLVYNLSVEEDESYVANGVVTHNCTIVSSVLTDEKNGYYIDPTCSELVNKNGNAWSNSVLAATFRTFIGAENYLEHVQIPELSKGKILDAVLRPLKYANEDTGSLVDVYFCDLLVATERKHTNLCRKIASGELDTMSMGCLANTIQCSKCGKILKDNEPNCNHLEHQLLGFFTDENGVKRVIAELCGHSTRNQTTGEWEGDKDSVNFIEASWVENPAFKGAVRNHFIGDVVLNDDAKRVLEFRTANLQEVVDDIFKLRVADKSGMMVLRVARQEILRRRKEEMTDRIAKSFFWN